MNSKKLLAGFEVLGAVVCHVRPSCAQTGSCHLADQLGPQGLLALSAFLFRKVQVLWKFQKAISGAKWCQEGSVLLELANGLLNHVDPASLARHSSTVGITTSSRRMFFFDLLKSAQMWCSLPWFFATTTGACHSVASSAFWWRPGMHSFIALIWHRATGVEALTSGA